jgi:hypothetical protein
VGIYFQLYNFKPAAQTHKPSGSIEYEVDSAASHERVMDLSEEVGSIPNASANQVTVGHLLSLTKFEPGETVRQQGSFAVTE